MKNLPTINGKKVDEMRVILEDRISDILKEYGFELEGLGRCVYCDEGMTFKGFEIKVNGGLSKTERDLQTYLEDHNQIDASKIASVDGKKLTLVGYRRSARTKPFIVLDLLSNKEFILDHEQMNRLFKAS